MPYVPIDPASKGKAARLLHAHWKPSAIAGNIHCHEVTVYRWENNIHMYGITSAYTYSYLSLCLKCQMSSTNDRQRSSPRIAFLTLL